MKVKIILDTRHCNKNGKYPLKLSMSAHGSTAFISLGIELETTQWDNNARRVVRHMNSTRINAYINKVLGDVELFLLDAETHGKTATQLRQMVTEHLHPTPPTSVMLVDVFGKFIATKSGHTRELYRSTLNRLLDYTYNSPLRLDDVDSDWLSDFDKFLSKKAPSQNARNAHLRGIRAVFNFAISKGLTNNYPFRGFKIKEVVTRKRSLSVEQLRTLFAYRSEDARVQEAVDIFKLTFLLIGINLVDLCNLRTISNNRIEYYRSKTKKLYSIKVEPEALEIINRYRGKEHLLYVLDNILNYHSYTSTINLFLKRVGAVEQVGQGRHKRNIYTPLIPNLTTYVARHSWATIAVNDLDAPYDVVSKALGHSETSGSHVTSVYVAFNQAKVDKLNREMIDWVLYGKK